MKHLVLLAAVLPAFGQLIAPTPAVTTPTEQPPVSFDVIHNLEKALNEKLTNAGGQERFDVIGSMRGLYLPSFGVVLTAEIDLIVTPGAYTLFNHQLAPEEVTRIHTRKLQQLKALQEVMRSMISSSAQRLHMIPGSERVVLAVRLLYSNWEDVTGLPHQIVMSADHRSAILGQIKEQSLR